MRSLTPEHVAADPSFLIVDVRPFTERIGELGFVPGSRSLPLCDVSPSQARVELSAQRDVGQRVALFCSSGRRSAKIIEGFAGASVDDVDHIEGGLLAWHAAGLPVVVVPSATLDEDDRAVSDVAGFRRMLLACFVAEATELSLAGAPLPNPFDPVALLTACFDEAGASWDRSRPEQLYAVVDRASSLFRRSGASMDAIAQNVGRMYATIARLESQISRA